MPHPGDRRLRRWLLIASVSLCLLVATAAVVGLAGGFDPVPPPEPPMVAVDERNEGEPWTVTVDGAVLAGNLEPAVLQEDGYWLAVIAEVEITDVESRRDAYEILCVRDVVGLARQHDEPSEGCPGAVEADDIRLVRDGSAVTTLHPGLPERVAYLWELAADAEPPAEVRVEIVGETYREDSLTGRMEWLDPAPRAQLLVPVEDRREEG
ncbi:MAG TPA: hypothetical protein VIL37_05310 [Natronosporangium sp.]